MKTKHLLKAAILFSSILFKSSGFSQTTYPSPLTIYSTSNPTLSIESDGGGANKSIIDFKPWRSRSGGAPVKLVSIDDAAYSAHFGIFTAPPGSSGSTAAIERMRVTSSGIVGIGTSSPIGMFHVKSNYGNSDFILESTDGSRWNMASMNGGSFTFYQNSTNLHRFTIDANGNIGIGNPNPSAKLHVGASLSGQAGITLGNIGDGGNLSVPFTASTGGYNIDFQGYRDIAQNQIGARIRGERINNYADNSALIQATDLAFYTSTGQDATRLTEKMRIKSSGDVIIGSAIARPKLGVGINPTSVLHLAASGKYGDEAYIQLQRWESNQGTMALALQPSGTATAINRAWGYGVWGGTNDLRIWNFNGTANSTSLIISGTNENVGIGTTNPKEKLSVNGTILAKKVKVSVKAEDWSDYVFDKNYKLRSLNSLEAFIKEKHHLPDIPSAEKVEKDGLDIGANQAALLRKIEELTLYMLEQSKEVKALKEKIASLEASKR